MSGSSETRFTSLYDDVLTMVLSYLPLDQKLKLRVVNKQFKRSHRRSCQWIAVRSSTASEREINFGYIWRVERETQVSVKFPEQMWSKGGEIKWIRKLRCYSLNWYCLCLRISHGDSRLSTSSHIKWLLTALKDVFDKLGRNPVGHLWCTNCQCNSNWISDAFIRKSSRLLWMRDA